MEMRRNVRNRRYVLKEEDVWLWLVNLVMLPTKGLRGVSLGLVNIEQDLRAYLSDANGAPLVLPEKLQGALGSIMVLLWDGL